MLKLIITLSCISMSMAGNFDVGKCTKCHDGNPENGGTQFPRLEGQSKTYFFNAMKSYQNLERHNKNAIALMSRRVNIDQETIKELAEFFNKMPAKPGIVSSDEKAIALGREIYHNGIPDRNVDSCTSCHGQNGEGRGKNPKLAGQYAGFLQHQMDSYINKTIENQETMMEISSSLTPEEREAVALYLQSL